MRSASESLPDDIDALKALVAEQAARNALLGDRTAELTNANTKLVAVNHEFELEVRYLREQLNLERARRFAARSEKLATDQILLFAAVDCPETPPEVAEQQMRIGAHTRKHGGRRALPASLPRVDIVHELSEAERHCPHDGARLDEIGEVVSEQLDIVPAQIRVLRHIRKRYACHCGQCVKTASLPAQPIPKSLAAPGLLAHITVSKYQDGLPLYRQEEILSRIGVELPRSTLAHWMVEAGVLIQPLINLLRDRLLAYDIVAMDETPVQVLKEPGRRAQSKSYMWLARGGPPDAPAILYDYDPSRGGQVPKRLLEGFHGYLQTDGYEGYRAVVETNHLVHVGCFAHARRKFDEAVKAQGRRTGSAAEALSRIGKLYAVEAAVRGEPPQIRQAYRDEHARPLLASLRSWLETRLPQVPAQSALGRALHYLNHEWPKLVRYLDDGRLEIDNNRTENSIRPFVMGRKAWLFSDSVAGVTASANLYSLIETAKANGLEPYCYLRHLYTELPHATTVAQIEALVPGICRADHILAH